MATHSKPRSRRSSRAPQSRRRRLAKIVGETWLLVLISHVVATAAVQLLVRLLHLPQ